MTPLILARHIANLTDARYFAARDVRWLAFNLSPGTPDYVDPSNMQVIREWVEGPDIVGEFAEGTPAAEVRAAAEFFPLDAVVVGSDTDLAELEGIPTIVRLPMHAEVVHAFTLKCPNPASVHLLLEPTPEEPDWQAANTWIKPLTDQFAIVIQYDGAADEVADLLSVTGAAGIALRGGEEEQVGVKSFDDIEAVFEALGL
jgi:phosphoribosylanthranilate isomerase